MNSKQLIWMLVFFLLASSVMATTNDQWIKYTMDEGSGTAIQDPISGLDAVLKAGTWNMTDGVSGGVSIELSGSQAGINLTKYYLSQLDGTKSWSIVYFIKPNDIGATSQYMFSARDAAMVHLGFNMGGNFDAVGILEMSSGAQIMSLDISEVFDVNVWYMMTYTYDPEGRLTLFVNKTNATSTGVAGTIDSGAATDSWLGSRTGSSEQFNGGLDHFMFFNRSLSATEVSDLYDEVTGGGGSVPNSSITPSFQAPANNTQHNVVGLDFVYNVSATNYSSATCNLFENDTIINTTDLSVPSGNFTYTQNYSSDTEGSFVYRVECNGTSEITGNNTWFNSSLLYIYIDRVLPEMNTTAFSTALLNSKTFNFTFTDSNLFSYRIMFDNYTLANDSNIAGTTANVSVTIEPNNYTAGLHLLNVSYSDGHTALEIPPWEYDVNVLTKSITYHFPDLQEEDFIKIKPINAIDFASTLSTQKITDRYNFVYDRSWLEKAVHGDDLHFRVESNHPIVVVKKDTYPAWLVIPELNKWVDFATEASIGGYDVVQIDPYTIEVQITDVVDDIITFESIGELNTITELYQIAIANISYSYSDPVVEEQFQSMTLTIDLFNASLFNFTNATLVYNNSIKPNTFTLNGTKSIFNATFETPEVENFSEILEFYWNFNITLNDGSYQYNNTNTTNQTIYNLFIDNCTNNTLPIITFYGKDEEAFTSLVYDFDIDLTLSYNDSELRDYNVQMTGRNNYSICIQNETADLDQYSIDAVINYDAENYSNRKWYIVDAPITANLSEVNLPLLDSTKASEIVHITYDKSTGSRVSEAYIKALRKYVGTGTSEIVEIAKTDDNGQTILKMQLADVLYSYIVEYNGEVVLITQDQKILTGNKRLNVDLGNDVLESFRQINNVYTDVACVNSTKTCSFTWSDTTGLVSTAYFYVYRHNGRGRQLLYSDTSTATAGIMSYTITENVTGNEYQAEGYIHTSTTYSLYSAGRSVLNYVLGLRETFGLLALMPYVWFFIAVVGLFLPQGGRDVVAGAGLAFIFGAIIGVIPFSIGSTIIIVIMLATYIGLMRS